MYEFYIVFYIALVCTAEHQQPLQNKKANKQHAHLHLNRSTAAVLLVRQRTTSRRTTRQDIVLEEEKNTKKYKEPIAIVSLC